MPQTESMRRAALVTGGAKGIGRAVCLALAENGMNIAVNYAGSAKDKWSSDMDSKDALLFGNELAATYLDGYNGVQ